MEKGNFLSALLRTGKTVFSTKDLALLWGEPNTGATRVRLHHFVKTGELYHIRQGLYATSRDYNRRELATRILIPSYVSFETVLVQEGLIFQYYETIFLASYTTREIEIDGQVYRFRKMKRKLLINPMGIELKSGTSTATCERAMLDMLYIDPDFYFDSFNGVDWEQVFEILPIYKTDFLAKKVNELYRKAQEVTR
ncbi:MAG TPA: hypothetical protein PK040_06435 [Anaerolineaceae bacterium]|nr:hypothetical protein [Anaerolineaceae bacterium]